MKIIAVFALFAILFTLSGCTTAQIKQAVEVKVAQDIAKKDCPTLIPDLQNQIVQANAAVPPDTSGAGCATVTIQLCQSLMKSTTTSGGKNTCSSTEFYNPNMKADGVTPIGCQFGIATSIEAQRLASRTPATPLKLPDYWLTGCAVVINDLNVSAMQFLGKLNLDLAKYGLGAALIP
jgi:hypothetical protein